MVVGGAEVGEGVAAELGEESVGKNPGDHGLGNDSGGGEGTDIGTFGRGGGRLFGGKMDGLEGAGEGGDRLHDGAEDERLAVSDSAFKAAGVVGRS